MIHRAIIIILLFFLALSCFPLITQAKTSSSLIQLDKNLRPLRGFWKCQANSPGKKLIHSVLSILPILGGHSYQLSYREQRSKAHPKPSSARWWIAWNKYQKRLVSGFANNSGSWGSGTSQGWSKQRITWTFLLSTQWRRRMSLRYVFHFKKTIPKKHHPSKSLHLEAQGKTPKGKWLPLMKWTCTKSRKIPEANNPTTKTKKE
mgnify:CR=1 FL=1